MKINWQLILLIVVDLFLGVYLVAAVTVLNKTDKANRLCETVNIQIEDKDATGFISKPEVEEQLIKAGLYPKMKPMNSIPIRKIEENLQHTPFVRTAECYKAQDGSVRIKLTQRMPKLRIKAASGDDYYIDDNNSIMPNSTYTSDLIIATGNINRWYAQNYLAPMTSAIISQDVWEKQIEQIHVLPDKGIELVPRVGDHVVYIGKLPESKNAKEREKLIKEFIEKKLERLETFYRYGLSQAGWNKYKLINLEFDNQIICKKK